MSRGAIATVVGLFLATGCTTLDIRWNRVATPYAQFLRDRNACLFAARELRHYGLPEPFGAGTSDKTITHGSTLMTCMRAEGYTYAPDGVFSLRQPDPRGEAWLQAHLRPPVPVAVPPPVIPTPPPSAPSPVTAPVSPSPALAPTAPAREPSEPSSPRVERPAPSAFAPAPELRTVHFDFDRADIRPEDAKLLDGNAAWLKSRSDLPIIVEGHCDERGTAAYNLGLGERRANAVKSGLVTRGIEAARITVLSYGESRPECRDHTEACWARNRRAVILVKSR